MSAGSYEERRSDEAREEGRTADAMVHALLAIRAELRTANLIAVAAADGIPITADGWDPLIGHSFPEGTALREEIREELDLEEPPA